MYVGSSVALTTVDEARAGSSAVTCVFCAGDVTLPVGRAERGLDVRAVLRAAAHADAGPRPGGRGGVAAGRHAAAGAAAEAAAHRPPRGRHRFPCLTLEPLPE